VVYGWCRLDVPHGLHWKGLTIIDTRHASQALSGTKWLLAANFRDNAEMMPHLIKQVWLLAALLPPNSLFVSIYESGSPDTWTGEREPMFKYSQEVAPGLEHWSASLAESTHTNSLVILGESILTSYWWAHALFRTPLSGGC